jgi:DNA adenine methylase
MTLTGLAPTTNENARIQRPAFNIYGGKWRIAGWIAGLLPAHGVYVEPFGGAASVLLSKPPSRKEVFNDLSGDVHNFFRVLRDEALGPRLVAALRMTQVSRREFEESLGDGDGGPLEWARRFFVRTCQSRANQTGKVTAGNFNPGNHIIRGHGEGDRWAGLVDNLEAVIARFRRVIVENRPAPLVIRDHDGEETLFYLDPPYPRGTRARFRQYDVEMTDADHEELAATLRGIRGMAAVSGYRCPMYDSLYDGWTRLDRAALNGGGKERVESVWLSPGTGTARKLF